MANKKNYSEDAKNFFLNEQNKKKQKELKEKYGMEHFESDNNTPPEIINNFLNYVQEFEDAYEKAERKKLIEILGFPNFKKIEELNSDEIQNEIEIVLDKYADYNINIDILEKDDVTDEEFYKFITEELPEHETDFMQIEGMTTNYIYEEFHPSNKLDAKDIIEWFASSLFKKDKKGIKTYLSKNELTFNGRRLSLTEFIDEFIKLIPETPKDFNNEILFKNFEFDDKSSGKVEVEFIITDKKTQTGSALKQKVLNLIFELEKSEYGGFDIKGCAVNN